MVASVNDFSARVKRLVQGPVRPEKAAKQRPECGIYSDLFTTDNLPEVQQHWHSEWTLKDVFQLPDLFPKRSIKFIRKGLSGTIIGFQQEINSHQQLRADNSSSVQRAPAAKNSFVRGKGSFFPFAPGGQSRPDTSNADIFTSYLANHEIHEAYTEIPGISPVALPDSASLGLSVDPAKWELSSVTKRSISQPTNGVSTNGAITSQSKGEVDEFLPQDFGKLSFTNRPLARSSRPKEKTWAHVVDVNKNMFNFHELVPDLAFRHPFELDTFQKEAVYHLEQAESVFVAAHTSAGKTVVAEYAIALANKHMTRAIYTSPIKALSNQKYRDFRQTFDSVGILTGDVQLNPEASCLIMTTEILRSMLYRGADLIRDVEFVIFDEVHYVNDQERGVVWEEVIIMLPEHITIIMLSATVPNTFEFANWVGRTKQKEIYVISTLKRPVPLEHHLYANKKLYKIVDENKQWLANGYKEATQALTRNKEAKPLVPATGRGRGANRGSGQRGAATTRGRGQAQPFVRGGTMKTMERHDKNVWIYLVNHLREKKLLPCVIFVFSKKRCEENATILSNIDLTMAVEKSQIHVTIEKALSRLKAADRVLPQIVRMRELLSRGIAVHHGGLLPIVKEMVEILFSRSLVKVLFATETFAMGVNMPARSVAFSGIRKHDGHGFRDLTPGEYTQMAGRAGRRGLDPTGTVIIVCGEDPPEVSTLSQMLMGNPYKLLSQFRLTYNMILNLLRVETLKIEEMIRRSFSENASQTMLPEQEKAVLGAEHKLLKLREEHGSELPREIKQCHAACARFTDSTISILQEAMELSGKKLFGPGRVVLIQDSQLSRTLAVMISESAHSTARHRSFTMLLFKNRDAAKRSSDLVPFLPAFRKLITHALIGEKMTLEIIPATSLDWVTKTTIRLDPSAIRQRIKSEWDSVYEQITTVFTDLDAPAYDEMDWSKVRSIELQDTLLEKEAAAIEAQAIDRKSPDFLHNFAASHEEYLLQAHINSLKASLSDQNLELLPDYEQRIRVLQDLGFIDSAHSVVLKGRVACEINSTHELILSELILENTLSDFECEEIISLLSSFVFEERTDNEPSLTPHLVHGRELIIQMARRVNEVQERHQVLTAGSGDEFEDSSRFGLMEVCYEWARGMSFAEITELTDVLEGTIVRCIVRLDEVLRECQSAARTVGDSAMHLKMERCRELIKRDVVFSASLFW